jgi:hypothetical protein
MMLEYIEIFKERLRERSVFLMVLLFSFLNLSACGGSNGDDKFKEAIKVNYLNIASIEVVSDNSVVEIGVTEIYRAIANAGTDSEADVTSSVRWISSNDAVVSINSSGVATTLSEGVVEIRAEMSDLYGSKDLNSSPALLESIDIVRTEMPDTVGVCTNGYQLIALGNYVDEADSRIITEIVDWVSNNVALATVSEGGEVATLKGGAVTFTASRDSEGAPITGTADLTIDRDLLTSIAVTPDTEVVVLVGSNQQFKAMGTYSDLAEPVDITTTVDWLASNSDEDATSEPLDISAGGLAKGVSVGISDVTASCAGDPDASPDAIDPAATSIAINVEIKAPVTLTGIKINDGDEFENVELADSSIQLSATLVYSDGLSPTDVTDDSDTIWTVKSGAATLSELTSEQGEVFFAATGTSVISVFYTDANDTKVSAEISIVVN